MWAASFGLLNSRNLKQVEFQKWMRNCYLYPRALIHVYVPLRAHGHVEVLSTWQLRAWAPALGIGVPGLPLIGTLHAGDRNLSSKALPWHTTKNFEEGALASAVSNVAFKNNKYF